MAVFEQERHVELVEGADQLFFITSRMVSATIPDQLPHLNVFVITVTDEQNPKLDTLARVANLADLTLIPIGRDPGIAAPGLNGIEYLADSSTNTYTTLETANDAAVAFQDRVNALIQEWITFRTEFNAPEPTPAFYTFPTVDPSQLDALVAAYGAAKQSGYAQLQTKTAADTTLLLAQADFTYKQSLVLGATTLVTDTTKVKDAFTSTVTQYGSLLTAANTFYSLNPGGTGAAAMAAAIATANAQQAAMPGYLSDAILAVTDATNYLTARQNDMTLAGTAQATAQSNAITQNQILIAANATTAAALAAVLAICPDFDASTVPFVPG